MSLPQPDEPDAGAFSSPIASVSQKAPQGVRGATPPPSTAFAFKLDACWKGRATHPRRLQVRRPAELEPAGRLPLFRFHRREAERLKGVPLPFRLRHAPERGLPLQGTASAGSSAYI